MVRLDSENYTSYSESSPRTMAIDTLQIHHATTTSLAALRALMAPGGRTVSANGAMGNDGHLMGVVQEHRRAFTSATSYDNRSYTIEVCNTSLAPDWGISDICHWRLAAVAVDLHDQYGMPLDRNHIIGHREVPGAYSTACPGPSMDLNRIVEYAYAILAARGTTASGGTRPIPEFEYEKDIEMLFLRVADDGNGKPYFTLLNTNTNVYATPIYTVAPAGWTKAFGQFVNFERDDFIELTDTIEDLTGNPAHLGPKP